MEGQPQALLSLPPPTLSECHGGLARRFVAVRRRAILMLPKGERPHPRRSDRRRVYLEDAPSAAIGLLPGTVD
jgi:hypothetical protein